MPAAHGKTFGLEEQEDPGAEQRQTALTTHGMCRMLSLASLKSLKLGTGRVPHTAARSSPTLGTAWSTLCQAGPAQGRGTAQAAPGTA